MESESSSACKRSMNEKFEERKRLKIDCNVEKNKIEEYEESVEEECEKISPYRFINVKNDEQDKKYDKEPEGAKILEKDEINEITEEIISSEEKDREKEESFFLKMYISTLRIVMSKKDVNDTDVIEAITRIKESFHPPYTFNTVDFKSWDNICGYLFRYGAHGAGFASFRILSALRNCKELKLAVDKNELRVICLGSGPGNDAVGFCSALAEFHFPNNLIITAVDKFKEWSLCVEVVKDILKKEEMGKVSELFQSKDINFSFIQVNLPGDPEEDKDYFLALSESNIIIISKLLSILDYKRCLSITQSLYKNMKKEALILLNDTFTDGQWNDFKTLYSWGSKETQVYQSTAMVGWSRRFLASDDTTSKLPITVLTKIEN